MKKIVLAFFCFLSLFSAVLVKAQTFTVTSDTVLVPPFSSSATPHDDITNITANNLTIKWNVIGTNFPADWLLGAAFGICDNSLCRINSGGVLWNTSTSSGNTFTSTYNANSIHDTTETFDLTLDFSSATSTGAHWVTINLADQGTGGTNKNITFIVNKLPLAVPTVSSSVNDIVLYPNPANSELNIVYDANSDIKNIAVYNIIGKVMTVYKVAGTSANLNIESIPSGIYFVRLYNSQGNVLVTRKFTKQ